MTRFNETLSYDLPRAMDLLAAQQLKEGLLDLYSQEGDVLLDASGVERIATPCIEVLVAASAAFAGVDRTFHIKNPSQYFCDALETVGLWQTLDKWRA